MSAEFRQVTLGGRSGRPERLFRAAIAAFCSLTRPSRREITQLDDLTLPLFDSVSAEGRRFAAAALSESRYVPPRLIQRLCDEPVTVCAPLLVRSPALRDIDLIRLIGRHGLGHARAIARRHPLNPAIADLLNLLRDPGIARLHRPTRDPIADTPSADTVRERLRALMDSDAPDRQASAAKPSTSGRAEPSDVFDRLREAALSGRTAPFHDALAEALAITPARAQAITDAPGYGELILSLRALRLGEEQAFLIVAAIKSRVFDGPHAVRLFLSRFRLVSAAAMARKLAAWQSEMKAAVEPDLNPVIRRA